MSNSILESESASGNDTADNTAGDTSPTRPEASPPPR